MIPSFSLAEVLIALSIIGIVAAITIPILFRNLETLRLRRTWAAHYTILSQATSRLAMDNGGSLLGLFTDYNPMRDKFLTYFSYIKSCTGNTPGNCWHTNDGSSKRLNGEAITNWVTQVGGLVLSNGSMVIFYYRNNSSTCTNVGYTLPDCGYIVIDTNGFKPPNIIGKDIYWVHVMENGQIKPFGVQGDSNLTNLTCLDNSTDANNSGNGCAAKYLMQ